MYDTDVRAVTKGARGLQAARSLLGEDGEANIPAPKRAPLADEASQKGGRSDMQPRGHAWRTLAALLVCFWSWQVGSACVSAEGPGTSPAEKPEVADEAVVARVGATVFTLKDIRAKLAELAPPYRYAAERRLPEVVKEIVQQEMLWREAQRLGLDKDPAVRRQIDETTKQILTRELFMREVRKKALPSDEEVQRYYAGHPAEFSTPERQEERHIVVPTQAEAEAILAEIRAGKDFEVLAKARARDADEEGGVLSFSRGQRDAEIERVAFGLKVGEVGGPVGTPQGYQLIKVVARHPASRQPLELAKPVIQARLQPQKEKKLLEELLARIRAEQKAEIHEDLLKAAMPRERTP
jgi:peptidyl-prolyl cis-trans isomerase C